MKTLVSYKNTAAGKEVTVEGNNKKEVSRLWHMGMRVIFPNWNFRYQIRGTNGRFSKRGGGGV